MSKVRIGFVGGGGMGQMAHLSNYAVLKDECEVVALAEIRPQSAALVAQRYGIPEVYGTHHELIANAKVDAIVAPQQYRNHAALIPDILRAGIPVFTEKPLSLTVEAGRELVRVSEETGTLHMVGYHKRSDPAMERAKKEVDAWKTSGDFGKLRSIRVTMPPGDWTAAADQPLNAGDPYPALTPEPGPADYTDDQTRELDIFVNYYIHQVNAIRFFLGENYKLTFGDRAGVLLVGESDSGVTVSLEMAPYLTSIEWHEHINVAFDNGFVRVDLPAPLVRQQAGKVTIYKDSAKAGAPEIIQPIMPNVSAMRNQARNFLAAVRGERPAPCASKEALEDLIFARSYIDFMSKTYGNGLAKV
ncbi:Gfo/Idh/MocA family protein [Paenibacillus sacheonensis]|uniref:Gfo/Idh/MocA family oxidoreductase n=1 Tax=Paenibacillus sacheonensis TaxID=742054 RepID=A0A7X5C2F8_9BACL|nr:Gfo/Idh/MocA family oxidoreductase [Paenibacillus sacheonensis]MBM7564899.1 putative dehydrogenase [Paenibacillus sacheonensis]NBC70309.1 Gfo/Idh/MocA family oxidoreductase [Paenibacillus sacheonensis]